MLHKLFVLTQSQEYPVGLTAAVSMHIMQSTANVHVNKKIISMNHFNYWRKWLICTQIITTFSGKKTQLQMKW